MRNILRTVSLNIIIYTLAGCSSTQRSEIPLEQDTTYKLRDRRPNPAPAWINDFESWQREKEKSSTNSIDGGMRYYLGESGDVSDRIVGCDVAEMSAKQRIASEVASLVSSKLGTLKSGQIFVNKDDPTGTKLRQHTESVIAQKSLAAISGARRYGTYWEERDYSSNGGNKSVYTCDVVIEIPEKQLDYLLKRAISNAPEAFVDESSKAEVKAALNSLDEEFSGYFSKRKTGE